MKRKMISNAELKDFVNSDEFEIIVQGNSERYKWKWLAWAEKEETISLKNKISWNWGAFFFSSLWLLYRKMYSKFYQFCGFLFIPIIFTLTLPMLISAWVLTETKGSILLSIKIFLDTKSLITFRDVNPVVNFLIDTGIYSLDFTVIGILLVGIPSIIIGLYGDTWYLQQCLKFADTANKQFCHAISGTEIDTEITIEVGTEIGTQIGTKIDDVQKDDKENFLWHTAGSNVWALWLTFVILIGPFIFCCMLIGKYVDL